MSLTPERPQGAITPLTSDNSQRKTPKPFAIQLIFFNFATIIRI